MAKVLLVEDDNNLREIFGMRLQAEGYDTVSAGDGEEALVVAIKEKPDLVIADVMMPKLSGFEMLETLRAAPGIGGVKVIMMTALGQAEDRARGEKLGVVKYLVKSQVTLEDFVRVVREVLPPDGVGTEGSSSSTTNNEGSEKNNNDQESEKPMQPDNQMPTDPSPADAGAPADVNPITDAPMVDANSSSAMPTAQEESAVQDQINDFVAGDAPAAPAADMSAPAADDVAATPATDAPATDNTFTPAPDATVTPETDSVPVAPAPPAEETSDMPAAPAEGEGQQTAPTEPTPPAL